MTDQTSSDLNSARFEAPASGRAPVCEDHGPDCIGHAWLRPVVHLHAPTTGPVCGAPVPTDRTKMTAYRSETTCPACLATLRPLGGAA